jgi:hypothetical protein
MRPQQRLRLLVLCLTLTYMTGCSGTTTSIPPLPTGWKTVTHRGVGVDVPRDWTVKPWHQNCSVPQPTVFVGPEGRTALSCPKYISGVAEVVLGALPLLDQHTVTENLNGLAASVTISDEPFHHPHLASTVTRISVNLPTKDMTISLSIAESPKVPGGAAGRAEEILHTIHAVAT